MVEIVWEFVVKNEARDHFELTYGPGGAWSNLFSGTPGFRGMTVLRDTKDPQRYLTIEVWDTEAQRDQALDEHQVAYSQLEADLGAWTDAKREVGVYSVVAEASVRRRGSARQIKTGETRRSRR